MIEQERADTIWTRAVHVWDPVSGRHTLSVKTFFAILTDRRFLLYVSLALLLLFATDPSGNRPYVPLWVSFSVWPVSFLMYISVYGFVIFLIALASRHWATLCVPTALISLCGLIPAVYITDEFILDVMSNGQFPHELRGRVMFYFLTVFVIETIFFKFVYPWLETDAHTPSPPETPERYVIVGKERIPVDDIYLIEAREHHVHITTRTSEKRVRARLGDILAQMSTADGIQPHRSWWVSRYAAKAVIETDGRRSLRLNCDREIPIARTRLEDVRNWVGDHLQMRTQTSSQVSKLWNSG